MSAGLVEQVARAMCEEEGYIWPERRRRWERLARVAVPVIAKAVDEMKMPSWDVHDDDEAAWNDNCNSIACTLYEACE